MQQLALIGLVKIVLPAATIRLSDGIEIVFGGETYVPRDPVFGTLGGIDAMGDGIGDEVPALNMTLLPPTTTAAAVLAAPGHQQSPVSIWLGEYNPATGQIVGTPARLFYGRLDQSVLTVTRESRDLTMTVVSNAERLFELNIGNALSQGWHKSIWPGEAGHDNATGLGRAVAWGVEAPR